MCLLVAVDLLSFQSSINRHRVSHLLIFAFPRAGLTNVGAIHARDTRQVHISAKEDRIFIGSVAKTDLQLRKRSHTYGMVCSRNMRAVFRA
jgi:hypothetical protein